MHLSYITFKHLNSPENLQDAASSRKAHSKLLLRWVISLLVVYLAEPIARLLDWLPLFPLLRVVFVGLVLLEGKFAVGVGRRCEAYLGTLEGKCGWIFDYLEAGSVYVRVKLAVWMLKWAQPVLKRAQKHTIKEILSLCEACKAAVPAETEDLASPCLSPKEETADFSPSPPPNIPNSSIISCRRLETSNSQSSLKTDTSFSLPPKPPQGPNALSRTITSSKLRLESKESVWTVSILLQTKKATRAEPALYTPHSLWFEPGRKMLFWQAVGEENPHSEVVLTAKIPPKSSLLLHIECMDGLKVVRFTDPERFATWSQRLIKAVGRF